MIPLLLHAFLHVTSIYSSGLRSTMNHFSFYQSLLQMGLLAVTDKAAMAEDIPATVKQVMVQEGEGMDQVKVFSLVNRASTFLYVRI